MFAPPWAVSLQRFQFIAEAAPSNGAVSGFASAATIAPVGPLSLSGWPDWRCSSSTYPLYTVPRQVNRQSRLRSSLYSAAPLSNPVSFPYIDDCTIGVISKYGNGRRCATPTLGTIVSKATTPRVSPAGAAPAPSRAAYLVRWRRPATRPASTWPSRGLWIGTAAQRASVCRRAGYQREMQRITQRRLL